MALATAAVVALMPSLPAEAETAADCYARLNAVRVRTGLPRASSRTLAATAPLAGGTAYHVRVSGYVQATAGGPWTRLRTRAWSFTTA